MMNGGQLPTNQLHDINWGARDACVCVYDIVRVDECIRRVCGRISTNEQSCVHTCVCVCVYACVVRVSACVCVTQCTSAFVLMLHIITRVNSNAKSQFLSSSL